MFWQWICWMCQAHGCHYNKYTHEWHMKAERRTWFMGEENVYGDNRPYVISYNNLNFGG